MILESILLCQKEAFKVHILGLKHPAQEKSMGRKFCKFKTGFKKVKRADNARADSLGNLTFFS